MQLLQLPEQTGTTLRPEEQLLLIIWWLEDLTSAGVCHLLRDMLVLHQFVGVSLCFYCSVGVVSVGCIGCLEGSRNKSWTQFIGAGSLWVCLMCLFSYAKSEPQRDTTAY